MDIDYRMLIPFEKIKTAPNEVFEIVDEYGKAILLDNNLPVYVIMKSMTDQKNDDTDYVEDKTMDSPYTLHDAMRIVLMEAPNNQMHASELADTIFDQKLYFQKNGEKAGYNQVRARVGHYNDMFEALPNNIIRLKISNVKTDIVRVSEIDRQSLDIDVIWEKIKSLEGEEFKQKRGQVFTYTVKGNTIIPSTTDWYIPKSSFEKALQYVPLKNVAVIQRISQGPSYVYAILMDQRIREGLW